MGVRSRVLFSTGVVVVTNVLSVAVLTVPSNRTALLKHVAIYIISNPADGNLFLNRRRLGLVVAVLNKWTQLNDGDFVEWDTPEWIAGNPGDVFTLDVEFDSSPTTLTADGSGALLSGAPE